MEGDLADGIRPGFAGPLSWQGSGRMLMLAKENPGGGPFFLDVLDSSDVLRPARPHESLGASLVQKKSASYPACSWLGFLKYYAHLFLLFVKIGAISPPCYASYYFEKSILKSLF